MPRSLQKVFKVYIAILHYEYIRIRKAARAHMFSPSVPPASPKEPSDLSHGFFHLGALQSIVQHEASPSIAKHDIQRKAQKNNRKI